MEIHDGLFDIMMAPYSSKISVSDFVGIRLKLFFLMVASVAAARVVDI